MEGVKFAQRNVLLLLQRTLVRRRSLISELGIMNAPVIARYKPGMLPPADGTLRRTRPASATTFGGLLNGGRKVSHKLPLKVWYFPELSHFQQP